jgi:hypothetical protein
MDKQFTHLIPLVGLKEIKLFPPADRVFGVLLKNRERKRLNALRHLGYLTHALPGARHMRWDYTVAMLHYASLLKRMPNASNSFRIEGIEYSSLVAALQCTALIWNIGHLPGTFAVEKGVYRFLHSQNPKNPADGIGWPNPVDPIVHNIRQKANEFLRDEDYLGISRVLAVLKLLTFSGDEDNWFKEWIISFAAPFLLNYEDSSYQWEKVSTVFPIIRHSAYLTLDFSLSGLNWGPNVPALIDNIAERSHSFNELANVISEVLSPIEHQVYQNLYHNESVRKEVAILSDQAFRRLKDVDSPSSLINRWLKYSLFRDLKLGRRQPHAKCEVSASLRLRSHFSAVLESAVQIEKELRAKRFDLPVASEYRPWNSDVMIEPDEIIVDVMTLGQPTTRDVGKLLAWCISKFEDFTAKPQDEFSILRKLELESTYLDLLKRAINLAFPDVDVRFQPWPLAQFGIFKDFLEAASKGGVWAASNRIDDPISKYIFRDRSSHISSKFNAEYTELQGIASLRRLLMRRWLRAVPRHKCLLVTGSIRFTKEERDLIEYDGGILTASSRGGRMTWYGLESKSAGTDPAQTLTRKLGLMGVSATVYPISSKHAYVKLPI